QTGVTDAAGNAGTGSTNSANYAVDTATPTVTVANADNALKVGDTSVVTFTFSEAVTGFTAADVNVGNGSITAPVSTNGGLTWTATLTPTTATTAAANVIGVDKTGVTDAAGNAGTGSTNSANYAIDTATPTVTVANADNALKVGDTSVVTFTFSEAVTGFTAADVNVGNGTITTPASTDGGLTWTATLTPTASTTAATNVIGVDKTGVTDAAGNAGTGSTNSANYAIDTATPTVTVVNADNALKVGDTSVVTFTFSEAVTGFTAADVSVGNGNITTPASTDGGLTWTATLTPTAATTAATNVIGVDKTGVTDAAGNAGTGSTNSANYAIDTAAPSSPVMGVVATDDAVNSSEATAGFNISGTGEIGATVTVTLGSAITLSGGNTALVDSNGNWSVAVVDADVTAMGEGSESISATQTDTAGNVSAASLVKTISVAAGTAFTLIAGTDTYAGTVRNDTFTGAYDANTGVDTFDITDVLNGGAGTADTLVINHVIGGVAIAPPDALWTGISNIEKLVLNTSGAGAQTLTTGPFFEAAFHNADVAGVDLTLTTTGGGAIDLTMLSFHGSATLTTTSTDGAQTIQTSPDGVATVSATSGAGALNIAGVGLTTVVAAVTTGNGAQNIGGFTGSGSVADGGSHLTSVNATAAGGAQTIISTSTGDVTINATSGDGAVNITTGTGNDTISLFATTAAGANSITSGAGADTVNLYTNFSSVDTIVQANGDSKAMTVNTTSSIIATGETITFGNGLDIIHGFTGGVDHLDVGTPGAAVSGLGMSEIAFTAAKTVFLSGAYSGGVFTIADDATGADTLLLDSTATDDQTIATADTWILLVGTNSGTLDTNSFI
ncbi:MAG: Ig-like domain-containing protein, partial [Methylobacter sp.]|nr:Ig-like domain-containing protein [Methylobacter sp.]